MSPAHEKTYEPAEIVRTLAKDLPNWEYREGWIRRRYKTPGWPHTLMLVNAIGFLAESVFHHPDLNVSWAMVDVKLQTHSAGGITDKDFQLARLIEQRVTWLPGENAPFDGFEKGFGKKWIR